MHASTTKVKRLKKRPRHQRGPLEHQAPPRRNRIRFSCWRDVIQIVVKATPLFGVEGPAAKPVDDVQVVKDLVRAHLVQCADRQHQVCVVVGKLLELLRLEKDESRTRHLCRDLFVPFEWPKSERGDLGQYGREVPLRHVEGRWNVHDVVLDLWGSRGEDEGKSTVPGADLHRTTNSMARGEAGHDR